MSEDVYNLWEIPMNRPSIVFNALKFIDQEPLLSLLNQREKLSRAKLMSVVDLAIKSGAIQTVKARLPTGEVFIFVDLATFASEFDQFISSVIQHEQEITESDIRRVLKNSRVGRINFSRTVLQLVTSNKWGLRLVEKFYSLPAQFFRLASMSAFFPSQIYEEISSLLNLLVSTRPKDILEIGTDKGGTLYFFTKVADESATLVSVDLHIGNSHPLPAGHSA